ncbi:hypothetical protein L1887_20602 [Cichorium endivia]|nr:hypothetical protein L1887_20602 [Cichorium endivia]
MGSLPNMRQLGDNGCKNESGGQHRRRVAATIAEDERDSGINRISNKTSNIPTDLSKSHLISRAFSETETLISN